MKKGLFELLENKTISFVLEGLSLLTFIVANLIIFFVFSHFYFKLSALSLIKATIIFIFGVIISIIIGKTEFLIDQFKKKPKKEEVKKGVIDAEVVEKGKPFSENEAFELKNIDVGTVNSFFILCRLIFFNIAKDLFLILIIWTSLFAFLYWINLVNFVGNTTFAGLAGVLSTIGIIAGIFQFYTHFYRQQVIEKIIRSMIQYFIKISQKISYDEFLEYLKNHKKAIYNSVVNSEPSKLYPPLQVIAAKNRGKENNLYVFNFYNPSDLMIAMAVELAQDKNISEKQRLINEYKAFFREKNREIKEELDKINVRGLRRILLPNIIFFDEILAEIVKMTYENEEEKENESFNDFQIEFIYENVSYLLKRILRG